MDENTPDYGVKLKKFLDDHFDPMIPPEWKDEFSLYEIGALPRKDGSLDTVIVWVRSTFIAKHSDYLLNSQSMSIDKEKRERLDNKDGSLRMRGDTLLVRLLKQITEGESEPTTLLVEIFQVFQSEDDAKAVHSSITPSTMPN